MGCTGLLKNTNAPVSSGATVLQLFPFTFTFTQLCKLRSDRFATIGPVAASPLLGFGQPPHSGNISIIDFHGTNDMVGWLGLEDFVFAFWIWGVLSDTVVRIQIGTILGDSI